MEFGCGQDDCVTELVRGCDGLDVVKIRHDLQDIPRTVVCRNAARGAAMKAIVCSAGSSPAAFR